MPLRKEKKSGHILIVDDSEDNQCLLKLLLESNGYTTECTSNGAEALQLLHTSTNLPQTILVDLNMPVMGGLAFRLLQRVDPRLKDIRVVVMTGEHDVDAMMAEAGTEVLHKPFCMSSLLETVART